jgi:hypothetical protein
MVLKLTILGFSAHSDTPIGILTKLFIVFSSFILLLELLLDELSGQLKTLGWRRGGGDEAASSKGYLGSLADWRIIVEPDHFICEGEVSVAILD